MGFAFCLAKNRDTELRPEKRVWRACLSLDKSRVGGWTQTIVHTVSQPQAKQRWEQAAGSAEVKPEGPRAWQQKLSKGIVL